MHVKTMEGLIGARNNMELLNTPFRVYKEARLKGDTAKMEQAMGYMNDCYNAAYEYKEAADEGMQKDAEETRKIAEEQLEEAVRRRREEREELEKQMEERRDGDAGPDTVEISEEGRVLLKNNIDGGGTDTDGIGPDETKADAGREPVTYTKTGEAVSQEQSTNISVSV